ncbi:MAG: Rne/Rng family ribonuclease [Nocardioidaceae bacterium]
MTDDISTSSTEPAASGVGTDAPVRRARRRAASRPAGPPQPTPGPQLDAPLRPATSSPDTLQRPATSSPDSSQPAAVQRATVAPPPMTADTPTDAPAGTDAAGEAPVAKKAARRRTTKKAAPAEATPPPEPDAPADQVPSEAVASPPAEPPRTRRRRAVPVADPFAGAQPDGGDVDVLPAPSAAAPFSPIFQPPDPVGPPAPAQPVAEAGQVDDSESRPFAEVGENAPAADADAGSAPGEGGAAGEAAQATPSTRRRRSRGGRNRRKSQDSSTGESEAAAEATASADHQPAVQPDSQSQPASEADSTEVDDATATAGTTSSRRRRRRRSGDSGSDSSDDTAVVSKARQPRVPSQAITSVEGSTRLEAKKQRRRDGREAGRRRVPILSESEFLARREAVDRVMAIRQRADVTQIAVLEDDVLVEHYVALETQSSLLGNVYLGRVQNVLPSMEAAFVDIGKGRNAVLYAGEVNWDLVGDRHQARRIENALKPGQQILVQVSKDPVGHKGARLTSQISLPGRYLVYVPGGGSSGISRKLPDTERNRLKTLLKGVVPDEAGVIVRTAAEGASEDELTRDVLRLTERWDEIQQNAKTGKAPALLYAEPDTMLKVVRDLFTEDFATLVIAGDEAWDVVHEYVSYVAPDLVDRLERYDGDKDIFATYRVDEQIAKALERKVWLPSGGSLVIDRTEAMTVVDVNTGKFTGSGGNLEETVTKNNLEAAEEIVRQLRLRDIGGIIVVDFIDMVLESNRDLVLRRLVECLGRDRTRHQVAEVTSLGLVQITRKRIGTGLLESFSHDCAACHGRGVVIEEAPVEPRRSEDEPRRMPRRSRGSKGKQDNAESGNGNGNGRSPVPSPKDLAAATRPEAPEPPVVEPVETPETPMVEPVQTPETSEPPMVAPVETAEATEPPVVDPVEIQEPDAKPAVVTRTRRRSASRPAGPPAAVAATDDAEDAGAPASLAATEDHDPAPHVPVKRKGGARKR